MPWVTKLKKPITLDVEFQRPLSDQLVDLTTGVATKFNHRSMGRELMELAEEYKLQQASRSLDERSLLSLTGRTD